MACLVLDREQETDVSRRAFKIPDHAQWTVRPTPTLESWEPPLELAESNPDALFLWRRSPGSSIVRSLQDEVERLARLFIFRVPEAVTGFIRENGFLADVLEDAYVVVQRFFGPNPELVLEVVTDAEAQDDRQLWMFIRTGLPADEALASLEGLDQAWWLHAMPRARGRLGIHLEFE